MAKDIFSSSGNRALTPVTDAERVFRWHDHAALWFSLGVGLLVMQVGAYLVPAVGTRDAALAIVLGSLVGAGLLGWTAKLGCDSGLSSAGLMFATFGHRFARLPVLLNIAQLIGWTTFELVVMRDGTAAIAQQSFGLVLDGPGGRVATTVLWGAVLTLLLAGSMTALVRRIIGRFGLPLVIASLLWLTWQFGGQVQARGFDLFWTRPGDGSMGLPRCCCIFSSCCTHCACCCACCIECCSANASGCSGELPLFPVSGFGANATRPCCWPVAPRACVMAFLRFRSSRR